jgi:diaminopimelate epimerase
MELHFYKYQGTGNDFVVIDNRKGLIHLTSEQIVTLCDRRFGIGSDGLILLESDDQTDFYMNFYNPDASQSFCGNGSRCAVHFARFLGVVGEKSRFRAIDGLHDGEIHGDEIRIHMKDVESLEKRGADFVINTGSPHYVVYEENIGQKDIVAEAKKIRYNQEFSAVGINVNFVEPQQSGIAMRTYERGVEDETLSCGTGVTAAAISYSSKTGLTDIPVSTKGGLLRVRLEQSAKGFTSVWLCGPAVQVFQGVFDLKNEAI